MDNCKDIDRTYNIFSAEPRLMVLNCYTCAILSTSICNIEDIHYKWVAFVNLYVYIYLA